MAGTSWDPEKQFNNYQTPTGPAAFNPIAGASPQMPEQAPQQQANPLAEAIRRRLAQMQQQKAMMGGGGGQQGGMGGMGGGMGMGA